MQKVKSRNYADRHKKIISNIKDLPKLSVKLKKEGKKVVFTIGTFEFLNPGHCRYLAEAKSLGDVLVVGVTSDYSELLKRGNKELLVTEKLRSELVSYLKSVDYVVFTEDINPYAVLFMLKPDIFFTSENSWDRGVRGFQDRLIAKSYGGKIIKRKREMPYYDTFDFANHIANIRVVQILQNYLKERIHDFNLDPVNDLRPADFGRQKPKYKNAFDSRSLIVSNNDLEMLGEKVRKRGNRIVFVSGSYDLLHVGHARFIEQAGILGDILVVGIPSDSVLRFTKGIGRPIITEYSRAYTLGHLDPVDYVTIFDNGSVLSSLKALKPDVFFTVDEKWNNGYKKSPEYKFVTSYGGKIERAKRQAPLLSASLLIDKLASKKVREIFKECMEGL